MLTVRRVFFFSLFEFQGGMSAVLIEYTVASTSVEESKSAQKTNARLVTHQDTITEELARHGSTAEIENMHIINEAPEMQRQKMQNATDKVSRLQHLVNGLNQKLTKAKNDTLTQSVKCEKNTTNATQVIQEMKTEEHKEHKEQIGATGGVPQDNVQQSRADSLTSTVEFLRAARKRDSTLLAWTNSINRTNTSGVSVLTAIDDVALAHRSAKIARILYVRQLEGNRNKTMLLKQLDDEAMESVPEYGSKLVEGK